MRILFYAAMLGGVGVHAEAQISKIERDDQPRLDTLFSLPAVPDSLSQLNNQSWGYFLNQRDDLLERAESTGLIIGNTKYFIRIWPNPEKQLSQFILNKFTIPHKEQWRRRKEP